MKKFILPLLLAALLLVPAGALATRVSANSELNRDLAAVRAATAKYHDVNVAIADGYIVPGAEHCFEIDGVGAMGVHAFNPSLGMDAVIDPLKPELLLYAPTDEGLRLVGVEYFVAEELVAGTPSIFGQPFDGPMDGHEPGMPRHYDLHVWVWQNNPNGMFAQFNPNVSCN